MLRPRHLPARHLSARYRGNRTSCCLEWRLAGSLRRWRCVLVVGIFGFGASGAAVAQTSNLGSIEIVAGSTDVGDGGPATEATIAGIGGLALAKNGDLYFSDTGHNRVRHVAAKTGVISTVAGTGRIEGKLVDIATSHPLLTPGPIALDTKRSRLYVGEIVGHRVLELELKSGRIRDIGAPEAGLGQLVGLCWVGGRLLVADSLSGQVWAWNREVWTGLLSEAELSRGGIRSAVEDASGNLYISEFFGHQVRKWQPAEQRMSVVAGTGRAGGGRTQALANATDIGTPDGLVFNSEGKLLFADVGNSRVSRVDLASGVIDTVAVSGKGLNWTPGSLAIGADGALWVADVLMHRILRFSEAGPKVIAGGGAIGDGDNATEAMLSHPGRLAVGTKGEVYVSDAMQHRVRVIDADSGLIRTVAGTGVPGYNGDQVPGVLAQLNHPAGLAATHDGRLLIADYYNHRVRSLDTRSGVITTLAGSGLAGVEGDGGRAVDAALLNPHALSLSAEHQLLVTSAVAQSVRRIDLATGIIEGFKLDSRAVPPKRVIVFFGVAEAENGVYFADGFRNAVYYSRGRIMRRVAPSDLNYPMDVAVAPDGTLHASDTKNNRVVAWRDGRSETVLEGLGRPRGITFEPDGSLLVADTFHNRVLRLRFSEGSL